MGYEVTTEVFEGPFEVLFRLITSQEVDLHAISLSAIVDGFVAHVGQLIKIDLEVATEFAVIAATLIELKSRRLLPKSDLSDEEDLYLWEERDLLLTRLVESKTFQGAGTVLAEMIDRASLSFARRVGPEDQFRNLMPDLLGDIGVEDLVKALLKIKRESPPLPLKLDLAHVTQDPTFTLAQASNQILNRLKAKNALNFTELTGHLIEKIDVVVFFLAVLELFKRGFIELDQANTFGTLVCLFVGGEGDEISEEDVFDFGDISPYLDLEEEIDE